jgi:hypothetical protein
MLKTLSHFADAATSWRCSCGARCACEYIFNLHVEQHDRDTDCSHSSGWPTRHFLTAPRALTLQPGVVARNVHDHSLFLLLHCPSGSQRARDVVANSQSRCVSAAQRVSVMAAVSGGLWQSWTGSLPHTMKDFPPKTGCDGQQLFPPQSSHNMLFSIKCDCAADGQAAVDSILSDLGDHVESNLLVRGFKFNGGKDLTGAPRGAQLKFPPVSRVLQAFGTAPETQTTDCDQLSSRQALRAAAASCGSGCSSTISRRSAAWTRRARAP